MDRGSNTGTARTVDTADVVCAACGSATASRVGMGIDFEYGTCDNDFEYVRCGSCGHVYLKNRPVASELGTIYPSSYGNYQSDRSRALTFKVKALLDRRNVERLASHLTVPVRRVLDVGCADGRLLDVCRAAIPGVEALHGIEISERAAQGALDKGYHVTIGTVDDLALSGQTYELVFLQQVIEHVYAPGAVLTKLRECLAPGGLLVIETPTTDCVDYRLFHTRYWGGYHMPRHFNLFSERSLLGLCAAAGLKHLETRYTPQPIHWVWTLRHYMKERGYPRWMYRSLNIQSTPAIGAFTLVELAAGLATGRMSNMQVLAVRDG